MPVHGADPDAATHQLKTATPIKHVIIIVGENRSFDHLFATYKPKSKNEKVLNLLSEGIVNADGSPGPISSRAINSRSYPRPMAVNSSVARIW